MIFRTDIAAHLENGVKVGFLAGTKMYTPKRDAFAREAPSTGAFEIYADMGATPWPRQNGGNSGASTDPRTLVPAAGGIHAGGPVTVLGGNERGIIVFNLGWDIVIGIEHDAINDDRLGDLDIWARSAGMRFEQHKDQQCFDVLAQGTAAAPHGNGYDGLPLFSASHVDKGAEYQTAQSNLLSTLLTLDNYEAAKIAAAKFLDDRGQPVSYNHSLLIHPPDLKRTAAQITDGREDYSTTNRAINPYAGVDTRLEAPGTWLGSAAWYLIDQTQPQKPVILQVRQNAEPAMWDDLSQGSGVRYYRFYARYNAVAGPWRLVIQGHA
jgi:phage major head subunit gpT-like protein